MEIECKAELFIEIQILVEHLHPNLKIFDMITIQSE